MKRAVFLSIPLLLATFGLRLGAAWWWHERTQGTFWFGDSESYWTLARSIAEGEPYVYGEDRAKVFRTPGYPFILSSLFVFSGNHPSIWWARAFSVFFDTLSVLGVGWLAAKLFDRRASAIAMAVATVYPGSIATSILVLSEAPFCPLLLLHLGLWTAAWRAPSTRLALLLALLGGLAAGAATLVRPSWLLFVPFAVAIGLIFGPARRRHLAIGLAMSAGLVLAMSPWWMRNERVTGRFVPTTLQVGASLYDGLNPEATGASEMTFVAAFAEAQKRDPANSADTYEYRLDERMKRASLDWARSHPGRVIELAAIKFGRMWNVWPNEAAFSAWPVRVGVAITYVPVMLLGIVGVLVFSRQGWPYVLCWLPAVYFTLLHMVFVSSIRYRQPAMLGLLILAAGYVSSKMPATRPAPNPEHQPLNAVST
jgi:4-amino-4-deoxy-L-arabinose transferase-like glycosyltransferase